MAGVGGSWGLQASSFSGSMVASAGSRPEGLKLHCKLQLSVVSWLLGIVAPAATH